MNKIRVITGLVLLFAGIVGFLTSLVLAIPEDAKVVVLRQSWWILFPYGVVVLIVAAILILREVK